eukprot:TRINITY_DN4266_c0_g1_i1.p1 TRINITY_DN4266_c0_g1~~TRINITY_DN4266_c0_g1_i1.p1  ORF type:complete len:246 (-),score=-13.97 TRINITY_DN4266_c0_g1_i1:1356-2093(-)
MADVEIFEGRWKGDPGGGYKRQGESVDVCFCITTLLSWSFPPCSCKHSEPWQTVPINTSLKLKMRSSMLKSSTLTMLTTMRVAWVLREKGRSCRACYALNVHCPGHRLTTCRRRIDFRLLPILGIMYSISLVDRTNLGLALVAGMNEDLGLSIGNRYTILVMIFFVAYIIFEIPSVSVLIGSRGSSADDFHTESGPAKGRTCELAHIPGHFIRLDSYWYGIHKRLGNVGFMQSSAWGHRSRILAR